MAKPIPVSDSHRNGVNAGHFSWSSYTAADAGGGKAVAEAAPSSDPELWAGEPREAGDSAIEEAPNGRVRCDGAPEGSDVENTTDMDPLLQENLRLRTTLKEVEQFLEEATRQSSATADQMKEYEGLLEEKSEVIRELHRKLQEQPERPATSATPREEELLALSEELERERQQLKEDEETLMQQMRDMEVQMSRERAEIARQRNELQRLQGEIRHELEMASRDATLRERLAPLQRRHQELMSRRGAAPTSTPTPAPAAAPSEPEQAPKKDGSGLLRRFFG